MADKDVLKSSNADAYNEVVDALEALGVSGTDIDGINQLLAAVLHIGDVEFLPAPNVRWSSAHPTPLSTTHMDTTVERLDALP